MSDAEQVFFVFGVFAAAFAVVYLFIKGMDAAITYGNLKDRVKYHHDEGQKLYDRVIKLENWQEELTDEISLVSPSTKRKKS